LQQAQAVFGYTRLMVAAFGLGAGEEASETAVRYAKQRIQAGSPLVEKQGYMHKLVTRHFVKFEAARAFIDNTAKKLDVDNHGLATEGAIAKYYATEAGNNSAENSIQALGGYGYTKEFAVEKIKRDVKITCIYEGTNEIMEMTIYRGRWQEHLKTRGEYYNNMAKVLEEAHQKDANIGADSSALMLKALAIILEECRAQKLTRHQHVTFKLGELIAEAEVAKTFCEDISKGIFAEGSKFDRETLKTMARVNARQAAFKVVSEGMKLVLGAGQGSAEELTAKTNFVNIQDKQRGITQDLDKISDKLKEMF